MQAVPRRALDRPSAVALAGCHPRGAATDVPDSTLAARVRLPVSIDVQLHDATQVCDTARDERADDAFDAARAPTCESPTPPQWLRPSLFHEDDEREVRVSAVDLDRDGATDVIVTHTNVCDGHDNCYWNVFLMRHGCAHWVGTVHGALATPPRALSTRTHGVRVLETLGEGHCVHWKARYEFDGMRYRHVWNRECDECDTRTCDAHPVTDPERCDRADCTPLP